MPLKKDGLSHNHSGSSGRHPFFSRSGFTLIELMIVVAIIAILASIGIPQYVKYVKRSRTAEGVQHSRKLFNALVEWYTAPTLGNGVFPTDPQSESANKVTFKRTFPAEAAWWEAGDGYYSYIVTTTAHGTQGNTAIVTARAKGGDSDNRVFAVEIVTDVLNGPVITRTSSRF